MTPIDRMHTEKRRLLTTTPPRSAKAGAIASAAVAGESDPAGTAASAPVEKKPLSKWSVGWRVTVTVVAFAILTCGQFLNTNDFFPLGSLTQYATAKDLNGQVNSTCIAAQFPGEDEPRRLGFNTATVGIERGDVEAQLDRVIANPELLQTLADSYVRLHPDEPKPEAMILCRETTQLENGISVGEPTQRVLATWEVR